MTTIPDNFADLVGPVAVQEFNSAADHYKPGLIEWATKLHTLNDGEFLTETRSAIYNSALVNRFRGNWDHEHFKATACFTEGRRRHVAAGHSKECHGDTLYGLAYARVMRDNGYQPPASSPCTCGKD